MGRGQELLEGARNGDVQVVEKILAQITRRGGPIASLRRGAGVNVQDSNGYTPLHHACVRGHKEIARLLLAADASPCLVDSKGASPLHLAAWVGATDIVRMLLVHNTQPANVDLLTNDHETALLYAAQFGHVEVVALLLSYGADVTVRNNRDESALDLAAQYGKLKIVRHLLSARPQLVDPYRAPASRRLTFSHTPLHRASINGHRDVVSALLDAGVDPNVLTPNGTALHEAALCGKESVVSLLIQRGVKLNAKDHAGRTVAMLLSEFPEKATQRVREAILRSGPSSSRYYESEDDLPAIPVLDQSPYENSSNSMRIRRSPSELYDERRVSNASMSHAQLSNRPYVNLTVSPKPLSCAYKPHPELCVTAIPPPFTDVNNEIKNLFRMKKVLSTQSQCLDSSVIRVKELICCKPKQNNNTDTITNEDLTYKKEFNDCHLENDNVMVDNHELFFNTCNNRIKELKHLNSKSENSTYTKQEQVNGLSSVINSQYDNIDIKTVESESTRLDCDFNNDKNSNGPETDNFKYLLSESLHMLYELYKDLENINLKNNGEDAPDKSSQIDALKQSISALNSYIKHNFPQVSCSKEDLESAFCERKTPLKNNKFITQCSKKFSDLKTETATSSERNDNDDSQNFSSLCTNIVLDNEVSKDIQSCSYYSLKNEGKSHKNDILTFPLQKCQPKILPKPLPKPLRTFLDTASAMSEFKYDSQLSYTTMNESDNHSNSYGEKERNAGKLSFEDEEEKGNQSIRDNIKEALFKNEHDTENLQATEVTKIDNRATSSHVNNNMHEVHFDSFYVPMRPYPKQNKMDSDRSLKTLITHSSALDDIRSSDKVKNEKRVIDNCKKCTQYEYENVTNIKKCLCSELQTVKDQKPLISELNERLQGKSSNEMCSSTERLQDELMGNNCFEDKVILDNNEAFLDKIAVKIVDISPKLDSTNTITVQENTNLNDVHETKKSKCNDLIFTKTILSSVKSSLNHEVPNCFVCNKKISCSCATNRRAPMEFGLESGTEDSSTQNHKKAVCGRCNFGVNFSESDLFKNENENDETSESLLKKKFENVYRSTSLLCVSQISPETISENYLNTYSVYATMRPYPKQSRIVECNNPLTAPTDEPTPLTDTNISDKIELERCSCHIGETFTGCIYENATGIKRHQINQRQAEKFRRYSESELYEILKSELNSDIRTSLENIYDSNLKDDIDLKGQGLLNDAKVLLDDSVVDFFTGTRNSLTTNYNKICDNGNLDNNLGQKTKDEKNEKETNVNIHKSFQKFVKKIIWPHSKKKSYKSQKI